MSVKKHNSLCIVYEHMTFNFNSILDSFQKDDHQYAKIFLEEPDKFLQAISNNKDMASLMKSITKAFTKANTLPIMGGLSLLASKAIRPTEEFIKEKKQSRGLKLIDASANGAFIVYSTCCPGPNNTMFFKIAKGTGNVDAMEVEALGLQLIKKLAPVNLRKYFLSYCGTGKVICHDQNHTSYHLPLTSYLDGSLFLDQRSYSMGKNYVPVPFLITHAVPSGLSLETILNILEKLPTDQQSIDSMKLFLKTNHYEQIIASGGLSPEVNKKVVAHLLDKLEDFFSNVLKAAAPLSMGHADLHVGNILFDALNNNFVMIDFGRVTMDLQKLKIPVEDLWNEYSKITTKELPTGALVDLKQDPNVFYRFYNNTNTRFSYKTYPEQMATYNMLFDYAGLSYILTKRIEHLFGYKQNTSSVVSFKGWSIVLMPKENIAEFLKRNQKKLSIFKMSVIFFGLIIHALLDKNYKNIKNSCSVTSNGMFVVPEKLVMSVDGNTLFYSWGQPWAYHLGKIVDQIDVNCKEVGFYDVLESHLSKVKINGGSSVNKRLHISPSEFNKLNELTSFNYSKRAKAMRRNGKKTSKSVSVQSNNKI